MTGTGTLAPARACAGTAGCCCGGSLGGRRSLYWRTAASVDGLYPTQADVRRAPRPATAATPRSSRWPGRPARSTRLGGQVAWQTTAFGAIVAGLMSMFLVGRHTRAEEETGRDELLARGGGRARRAARRGRCSSRWSPTGARRARSRSGLIAYGLPVAGVGRRSALGVDACGLGLRRRSPLVAAQLTASTRAAYGIAGAVIAVAYVLRAVGDVGNGRAELAVADRLVPGDARVLRTRGGGRCCCWCVGSACRWWSAHRAAVARRDLGSGVLAARPGPARGAAGCADALRPGLATAARSRRSGGPSGCSSPASRTAPSATTSSDLVGDSTPSQERVRCSPAAIVVDGFYARRDPDARGDRMRLRDLVGRCDRRAEEHDGAPWRCCWRPPCRGRGALSGTSSSRSAGVGAGPGCSSGLGLAGYLLVTGDGAAAWDSPGRSSQYAAPVLVLQRRRSAALRAGAAVGRAGLGAAGRSPPW